MKTDVVFHVIFSPVVYSTTFFAMWSAVAMSIFSDVRSLNAENLSSNHKGMLQREISHCAGEMRDSATAAAAADQKTALQTRPQLGHPAFAV